MRSYRKSIWAGSFMSLMISASAGLFCSLILTALSALVIYFFLGDMRTVKYFSAGAIMVGGYVGSLICGRHRRRRGAFEGAVCGSVMYFFLTVCSLIVTGGFIGLKKLLLLVLSGAAGGAVGVNMKRPKTLRD